MGGVLGQLENRFGCWDLKTRMVPKLSRFQIRKVDDDMWLLITPMGWAYHYIDFDGCIKWLDYSLARYMRRMT